MEETGEREGGKCKGWEQLEGRRRKGMKRERPKKEDKEEGNGGGGRSRKGRGR